MLKLWKQIFLRLHNCSGWIDVSAVFAVDVFVWHVYLPNSNQILYLVISLHTEPPSFICITSGPIISAYWKKKKKQEKNNFVSEVTDNSLQGFTVTQQSLFSVVA